MSSNGDGEPRKGSRSPSPRRSKSRSRSPRESRKRSKSPRSPRSPRRSSRSRSHSPRRYSRRSPRRSPPKAEPSKVLGVFGLSASTRESDLREEFGKFGELEKAELILDKRSGNSRCFGFIYFASVEDAIKAKEAMNGIRLHGRNIRTDFSVTQRPHSPTPGKYMGRPSYNRSSRPPPRRYDDRYSPRRRSPRRYSPYHDRDSRRHYSRDDRDRYYDDRY